ncbi:MAG: hypothetical protein HHJ17_11515 [Rhodoferax sp.]|uniref:hypothetical protein n=1 Tax=Rhodoferax sp. TaxID=50421 RepID=UPI0018227DE3|nr:hypothetical protein [Rhodoferax sp.]NMM14150.1 hypothetical protein [Rhodoferax sp.]
MFTITLLATIFQVLGTIVLAFFSFYGIKISDNKDAYIEGVQKVEISGKWLRASQTALVVLVIGLVLSGGASLGSVP